MDNDVKNFLNELETEQVEREVNAKPPVSVTRMPHNHNVPVEQGIIRNDDGEAFELRQP